jgi:SAM-dependent methyltransferase
MLEIGCGSGQATIPFAERGCSIVALEPSPRLGDIAVLRLEPYHNVAILRESFEEFETTELFDAVLAATSFHWLDPITRIEKCASHLEENGALIVMTNQHPRPYSGFFKAVQSVYRRHVSAWGGSDAGWNTGVACDELLNAIARGDLFATVGIELFEWTRCYKRERYLDLLRTYSDHRCLGAARLEPLLAEIGDLIDDDYGGQVTRPYRTAVHVARRRA